MNGNGKPNFWEYMSPNEVARMVAELRDEASNLEDWNSRRTNWRAPPPAWEIAPLPKSPNDYGKVRTR